MSVLNHRCFQILIVITVVIVIFLVNQIDLINFKTIFADDVMRNATSITERRPQAQQQSTCKIPNIISSEVPPCIDRHARSFKRVEDIFCVKLPPFLPHLKNPCFYDMLQGSQRQLRCLPYFYILGMPKCGTTDLHSRLISHPDVLGNRGVLKKEVVFWSLGRYGFHYASTIPKKYLHDYLNNFDDTSMELTNNNSHNKVITGDATPMDMWNYRSWNLIPQNFDKPEPEILTPALLRYLYGDRSPPKMLILLREPVERLYSDYIFLRMGENPHTFHDHVLKSIAIMEECLKNKSERLCYSDDALYRRLPTRIPLGCYSVFLKEWLRVFPFSAFHVTRTEDRIKDTLQSIFSFLELEPLSDKDLELIATRRHKHVTKGKKGKILPETFAILSKFYRPCIEETATLLNDTRFLSEDIYALRSSKEKEEETKQ